MARRTIEPMAVVLSVPRDLDLDAYRRIAWEGEAVALPPSAVERLAERRQRFEAFVASRPDQRLYGITTAHHRGAQTLLAPEARAVYARRIPSTPATMGPPLPERVVRGIVAARLSGFLGGWAAVRPELAAAVAAMLERPLPPVPLHGHGDPGEIIALRTLFGGLEDQLVLEAKEGMALANGAPASAAALADGVLGGLGRLRVAEEVMALALEAALAPAAHLDAVLDAAWGDPFEAAALARLRELLAGGLAQRRDPQVAVAFRNAPRLLGWLRRTQAAAAECAAISLAAPGDNPLFAPGEDGGADRILSAAGYHDPRAAPSLNALAAAWADLATLATVQATRLAEDPAGLMASESEAAVTLLPMTAVGWAEEARLAATPTLISLGNPAPSDTSSPALLAWRRAEEAGTGLQAVLAVLGVVAAHALRAAGREPPPALAPRSERLLAAFPVGLPAGGYGPALTAIATQLEEEVHGDGSR